MGERSPERTLGQTQLTFLRRCHMAAKKKASKAKKKAPAKKGAAKKKK